MKTKHYFQKDYYILNGAYLSIQNILVIQHFLIESFFLSLLTLNNLAWEGLVLIITYIKHFLELNCVS